MKTCLSDDALLLCYLNEAPASVRLHVTTCTSCAGRYQQLSHTLASAERELRTGYPPRLLSFQESLSHWWFPATAALVAILVVLWSTTIRQPLEPSTYGGLHDPEVRRFFVEEIAPALSETSKPRVVPVLAPVSSAGYVSAALAGGWPCEQAYSFTPPRCEVAPLFFFFADQY